MARYLYINYLQSELDWLYPLRKQIYDSIHLLKQLPVLRRLLYPLTFEICILRTALSNSLLQGQQEVCANKKKGIVNNQTMSSIFLLHDS